MSVVIGVHPGGKSHFAVCALFWSGRLPATFFLARSYSSVQEVLGDIVGVYGEWGEITAVAIDSPLTWSAGPGGARRCDRELREHLPKWFPGPWLRPPNALPGASTVQGPALVWSMAKEAKDGVLPKPQLVEANARASLARMAPDLRQHIIGYRKRASGDASRALHLERLINRFVDTGLIRLEVGQPDNPDELDALVCATTALGRTCPESGLIIREFAGEEIRPVGRRPLCVIDALP